MIREGDKLEVFEFFVEDQTLPKFQKKRRGKQDKFESDESEDSDVGPNRWGTGTARFVLNSVPTTTVGFTTTGTVATNVQVVPYYGEVKLEPIKEEKRWWQFWKAQPPAAPAPPPPEPEPMSVVEFFTHLKNNQEELKVVEARAKGYEKAIANALAARQNALVEKLQAGLNAYAMETQLVAIGLTKFLTEETVVKFAKQSKKGLRLDWVRNFGRTIPESIVAKMARANELGVFDNYAVLHYDPHAKAFMETEAEKAARRDPILFGLMRGRRVLYVVGDLTGEAAHPYR